LTCQANVVQGLFAGECLAEALHLKPGALLVHQDVLSCGPLAPFQSLEQWTSLREAYWDSMSTPGRSPFCDLNRELITNLPKLRDADSIVLWLGVGAAEQLLLAWMVQLLKLIDSGNRLSVVQFTRIGDRDQDVWGVGLLNAEQIKAHPAPEQPSPEAVSELDRCWTSVTSPEPAELLSLLSEDSAHLPFLRPSLQSLVDRYPDHQIGLSRWEAELLKYVKQKGPSVTRVVGYTMGYNLNADLVGDAYLFSRLRHLADPALPHPLVTLSGDSTAMRGCEVALTETGAAVLDGRANAVTLNGIDDWVLGVHLDSTIGSVWYRKEGTLVP
jgi:hypothetical protein